MIKYAPIHLLEEPILSDHGIALYVLRLDQLDGNCSGNKLFKLKYNITEAKKQGFKKVVSFGGAFSNHIHALALTSKEAGLTSIGIIRGECTGQLNETLQDAVNAGMELKFVSRAEYRRRHDLDYQNSLIQEFAGGYLIPEGGSNLLGVKGCMEIVEHIHYHLGEEYDLTVLPCGTAATLAGVVAAEYKKGNKGQVLGVSVLKNALSLDGCVDDFLTALNIKGAADWNINHDYHCGGYAKLNRELIDFIDAFQLRHSITIEPIYTGKCFFGLYQMIKKGLIKNKRIVVVHTGGLQGIRGMKDKINDIRQEQTFV